MSENEISGYQELLNVLEVVEEDEYKVYVYRRLENRKAWAWCDTYYNCAPTFENIRDKWGAGQYMIQIQPGKSSDLKKTSKSFFIQDVPNKVDNNTELLKILLSQKQDSTPMPTQYMDMVNKLLEGNVKNSLDLIKTAHRSLADNFQEQRQYNDNDDEDEDEDTEDLVNAESLYGILEGVLDQLPNENAFKTFLSNPIVRIVAKSIIGNSKEFNKLTNWLQSKVSSDDYMKILGNFKKVKNEI